jgi:hypothetical protein
MTLRVKLTLLLGALVCANATVWGAKTFLAGALDPILKALGG